METEKSSVEFGRVELKEIPKALFAPRSRHRKRRSDKQTSAHQAEVLHARVLFGTTAQFMAYPTHGRNVAASIVKIV